MLFRNDKFIIIAGPCQIESLEHTLKIATFLKDAVNHSTCQLIFKASYDKANRTSLSGKRGVGIEAGLKILTEVKKQLQIPVITDVHETKDVAAVSDVVDALQIPAFLCRQTDLLIAAGKSGKPVNIKKGQFMHPSDMAFAAEKVGIQDLALTERGTSFGYRDLVVDMRSLVIMRKLGFPVLFDATHSVQSPGGGNGESSGQREFILPLTKAALGTGIDGLFFECHDSPEKAPSDGAVMLRLDEVREVLRWVKALHQNAASKSAK